MTFHKRLMSFIQDVLLSTIKNVLYSDFYRDYPMLHYLFICDLYTNMILELAFDEKNNKTLYYKNLNFYFSFCHKTINFNPI